MPPGLYCEDEAAFRAVEKAAGVRRVENGFMQRVGDDPTWRPHLTVGGTMIRLATPAEAEILRAIARSATDPDKVERLVEARAREHEAEMDAAMRRLFVSKILGTAWDDPDPMTARGATAQGNFQILNSNWRRLDPGLGIKTRNAMSSTLEEQTRVALALLRSRGGRPQDWAPFNPALRAAIRRGDRAPLGAGVAKDAAALEPKLIKGLDGKEGLDLGNGTMKMPDGSIRSITRSGLEIPDAPAGGIGGRAGRADFADRLDRVADRMEGMGFHGQISLAVTGSGRQQVRATALKVRGRGGMSADLGVSEPGAKEDLSDWT